jgi:hypothetical protein
VTTDQDAPQHDGEHGEATAEGGGAKTVFKISDIRAVLQHGDVVPQNLELVEESGSSTSTARPSRCSLAL